MTTKINEEDMRDESHTFKPNAELFAGIRATRSHLNTQQALGKMNSREAGPHPVTKSKHRFGAIAFEPCDATKRLGTARETRTKR